MLLPAPPLSHDPLLLEPRPAGAAETRDRRRLTVHLCGAPGRADAEAFVRRVYARHFGAEVRHFAPALVSLDDDRGIAAVAGYRRADEAPLYLERYLDRPVEASLARQGLPTPPRSAIVEVGHLASERTGEGRRLILMLAPYLAQQGFQWVVGTLTEELRQLFTRLGVTPVTLGTATPSALGDEAAHWGSYYDHHPLVLGGQLTLALSSLASRRSGAGERS